MADVVREFIAAEIAGLEAVATIPAVASGYGVDLVCIDDLTPRMLETDAATTASLAQDAYHRLVTRRGSLPDDPDYGIDLISMLSAALTDEELQALPMRIANEVLKDDRLADATVECSFDYATKTLSIDMLLEPANYDITPFSLIITITDAASNMEIIG